MIHFHPSFSAMLYLSRIICQLTLRLFDSKKSNPKKATRYDSIWWLLIFTSGAIGLSSVSPTNAREQSSSEPTATAHQNDTVRPIVSLSLCSDRLLMAIAPPSGIAALSQYSIDSALMLDKLNTTYPIVKPRIEDLLPYRDATLLINERFYPRLVNQLNALNFDVISINDNPTSPQELTTLIQTFGEITGNHQAAQDLIERITRIESSLPELPRETGLVIGYNGLMTTLPQYNALLDLLNWQPTQAETTGRHQQLSLESLLKTPTDNMIFLTNTAYYSRANAYATHPILTTLNQKQFTTQLTTKYLSCYDHGIWLGASLIAEQKQQFLETVRSQ